MMMVFRLAVPQTHGLSNGIGLLGIVWSLSLVWKIRSIYVDRQPGPIPLIVRLIRCFFITSATLLTRLAGGCLQLKTH